MSPCLSLVVSLFICHFLQRDYLISNCPEVCCISSGQLHPSSSKIKGVLQKSFLFPLPSSSMDFNTQTIAFNNNTLHSFWRQNSWTSVCEMLKGKSHRDEKYSSTALCARHAAILTTATSNVRVVIFPLWRVTGKHLSGWVLFKHRKCKEELSNWWFLNGTGRQSIGLTTAYVVEFRQN